MFNKKTLMMLCTAVSNVMSQL
jgi:hypothetical protein